jgi:5-methylcytosine-specific restriction endonuclease McrA
LGEELLNSIEQDKAADPHCGIACKRCGTLLRPWDGDDINVVDYHVEEHYAIPMETPGKHNPSEKVRRQILSLYDHKCFGCGVREGLHIDHIVPRSKGGEAAFRNLQPLCEKCGQEKADQAPEELAVYLPIYFQGPPSDGYEGLFW